jgi:transposase
MTNYNLIIKLLKIHINTIPELRKSFNFKYKTQKYKLDIILSQILYILKTGNSWRSLNDSLLFTKEELKKRPNWNTVYQAYLKINNYDVFRDTFIYLFEKYIIKSPNKKLRIILTDTTFIPNKNGKECIGYNKHYNRKNGTKISLITDSNGMPFNIQVYNGKMNDSRILDDHLKNGNIIDDLFLDNYKKYFLADKGYDTNNLMEKLIDLKYIPIIPQNKRNIKDESKIRHLTKGKKQILKKRYKIECMFSKIKSFRRLSLRYDSKLSSFTGFIYLSLIAIISNK